MIVEEVQSSLFNSWFELSGRVQQINNGKARHVLTDRMETLRQQISVATPDTEPDFRQVLACITNYVSQRTGPRQIKSLIVFSC